VSCVALGVLLGIWAIGTVGCAQHASSTQTSYAPTPTSNYQVADSQPTQAVAVNAQPIAMLHGYLVDTDHEVEYIHFTGLTPGYVVGRVTDAVDSYGQVLVYHGTIYGRRDGNSLNVHIDWDNTIETDDLDITVQHGALSWSDAYGQHTADVATSGDFDAALSRLYDRANSE
jgi:hypothetical protein